MKFKITLTPSNYYQDEIKSTSSPIYMRIMLKEKYQMLDLKSWLIHMKLSNLHLLKRIKKLEATINTNNEEFINIESFIKLVKKYTNIEKLDCEILRTFVDNVLVYQAERIKGKKVQKIKIIYNFIGDINK